MSQSNIGKVVQVMGAVIDIRFENDNLPALNNAIEVENGDKKLIVEVAQHLGDDVVRCIAMASTDGLVRGAKAVDTGNTITVPVAKKLWAEFSMFWAKLLTTSPSLQLQRELLSTQKPRHTKNRLLPPKFLKQALRLSTLSALTQKAVR